MNKLDEYRKTIDQIDQEIIELYEKRMDIVKLVSIYKKENKLSTLDSSREKVMLEKNLKKIKNKDYSKYYIDILTSFIKASKLYQEDLKKNED